MVPRRWLRMLAAALLVAALSSAPSAQATIIKGWAVIEDNGFADTASLTWGVEGEDYELWGLTSVPTSVQEALTGPDLTQGIYIYDESLYIGMDIGFTDNVVTNGPGADLAIFTTEDWGGFYVAVAPVGQPLSEYLWCSAADWTFTEGGLTQYSVLVDLEDFGLAAGQPLGVMRYAYKTKTAKKKSAWTADDPKGKMALYGPSGVGAISAMAPEATTLTILGAGVLAMARKRRRKRAEAEPSQPA